MTEAALPPLALEEPKPGTGERLARWGLVAALHVVLLYGVLHLAVREEIISLPPSISVRLLPLEEPNKPEAPPAPPQPKPVVRKVAPVQPQPVLAAKATEAPATFAVAPQPPAPPPAPVAAVAAPPAPPAPVVAARFDADYLHNPKPVYPTFSSRNGEEGKVLLRVKVTTAGTAQELEIKQSSGYPRLDNAAREAVAKWRFVPAKRGDEAIESWVTVPVAFTLD
ncbi:MAG: energy transducer TonB [Rhodocyclaceae bacterium]|nr:energy transducer TonB [Rhodocyclaceae bacterium]